jgi:hypothetical protein
MAKFQRSLLEYVFEPLMEILPPKLLSCYLMQFISTLQAKAIVVEPFIYVLLARIQCEGGRTVQLLQQLSARMLPDSVPLAQYLLKVHDVSVKRAAIDCLMRLGEEKAVVEALLAQQLVVANMVGKFDCRRLKPCNTRCLGTHVWNEG